MKLSWQPRLEKIDMEELSYVGKSVPRKDGVEKATGRALYTVDMVLPGMLWGKILRSPYPHARILNIDTSRAEKLPGVKAVVTGKDTLGIKHGFVETPRYPPDQYPLAMDRVRYIGEEVAAVAAIDEYVAEEALDLIRVDYEELPGVFDPEEAMKPEAPEIHPSHPKVKEPYKNIGGKTESGWGNVEKGFDRILPRPRGSVRGAAKNTLLHGTPGHAGQFRSFREVKCLDFKSRPFH